MMLFFIALDVKKSRGSSMRKDFKKQLSDASRLSSWLTSVEWNFAKPYLISFEKHKSMHMNGTVCTSVELVRFCALNEPYHPYFSVKRSLFSQSKTPVLTDNGSHQRILTRCNDIGRGYRVELRNIVYALVQSISWLTVDAKEIIVRKLMSFLIRNARSVVLLIKRFPVYRSRLWKFRKQIIYLTSTDDLNHTIFGTRN